MPYAFTQLANDWSTLTSTEKEALFQGTNFQQATLAELQSLGEFKVLAMSDSSSGSASNLKVGGVHNDFLVLPRELFGTTFNKIKSMTLTEIINDTANAKIRYILTKDLTNYYTFKNGAWSQISTLDADTVISDGMSSDELALISSADWANFYDGDVDENGIGIGFAFHETSMTQSTAIDNLQLTVDMKGLWKKAEHTEDYTYGYSNNELQVQLLTNGSYKINYGTSTGGGGGSDIEYATDDDIDNLFN